MDFPTTRVEDWKYTRVTRITNKSFQQNKATVDASSYFMEGEKMHRLVYVNGYFDEKQSQILEDDALSIHSISELNEVYYGDLMEDVEENVFSLINKSFATEGKYIRVAKNKKAQYPIQIVHVLTGENVIANSRFFFQAEQGSKAEVFLTFHSEASENCFTNIALEGEIEGNAKLTIAKLQAENTSDFHIANEQFVQQSNSNFEINTITTGGLIVRNGLNVIVDGQNCYTELNGAYLGREKQHLDNHTFVDHLYSNCNSSETYKGVLDDKSTGVFNGKVIVRQDAQKIEAYQSNGNILLSDTATANSKPELEIYADDVRCSHGSTTGQLDEQAVFYLKSRGLSERSARQLLISAFIGEVLDKIENESFRATIDAHFKREFGWEF
jgi:Fe-S cluster assembly protein SufD